MPDAHNGGLVDGDPQRVTVIPPTAFESGTVEVDAIRKPRHEAPRFDRSRPVGRVEWSVRAPSNLQRTHNARRPGAGKSVSRLWSPEGQRIRLRTRSFNVAQSG